MFGRRVQTVSDGVETISTFNGIGELANEWARFDADGKITERFLFGANVDQLVAQWSLEQGLLWALTDRLGSIRDLMNNAGKILQHMNYTAFGAPIFITPAGGLSNHAATHPYAFTGRVWDSLANMNYFRARTFDPATGRFTSADPLRFDAGDMNLYRYLNNSVFNGTDPSGKMFAYFLSAAFITALYAPIVLFLDSYDCLYELKVKGEKASYKTAAKVFALAILMVFSVVAIVLALTGPWGWAAALGALGVAGVVGDITVRLIC